MVITWHGFSCVRIQGQTREKEVTLIADPFAPEDGKKLPRNFTADIVISSHDDPRRNNIAAISGGPFVISGPGEYEVNDVFVTGIETPRDPALGNGKGRNMSCFIVVGDLHLAHLGALEHPLEEGQLEGLNNIDILFLPVGGGDALDAKQAALVANQLEPRIIIPVHYRADGLGSKLDTVDAFLKAMGAGAVEAMPKLKIAKKDVPQEETKIVILEPQ